MAPKEIYGNEHVGGFGVSGRGADFAANGEGAREIDTVVDIIFDHKDSQGKNTVARRTARRLLEYFAHANPSARVHRRGRRRRRVSTYDFELSRSAARDLRARRFLPDAPVPPIGAGTPKSVRWPVDYVVTSLRLLKMKLKGKRASTSTAAATTACSTSSNMGQILFDPPSVFGWDWETAWVSSSTLLARYGFARDLTSARGGGGIELPAGS